MTAVGRPSLLSQFIDPVTYEWYIGPEEEEEEDLKEEFQELHLSEEEEESDDEGNDSGEAGRDEGDVEEKEAYTSDDDLPQLWEDSDTSLMLDSTVSFDGESAIQKHQAAEENGVVPPPPLERPRIIRTPSREVEETGNVTTTICYYCDETFDVLDPSEHVLRCQFEEKEGTAFELSPTAEEIFPCCHARPGVIPPCCLHCMQISTTDCSQLECPLCIFQSYWKKQTGGKCRPKRDKEAICQ